jgi:SAM-dependent methyltransferase
MTTQPTQQTQARVQQGVVAAMEMNLLWLGDQLGLFKYLASSGATTLDGLATGTKLDKRYLQEWLCGVVSAKYLTFDVVNGLYSIPPEHIPVLADESHPSFMGATVSLMCTSNVMMLKVKERFIKGGGIPQSEYPLELYEGMERHTGVKFRHELISEWIELVPSIKEKLSKGGARICDVGCGNGRALCILAKAFPNNEYIGYDIFEPGLAKCARNAEEAGVSIAFKKIENRIAALPDKPFDIIFVFDVIHDSADPLTLLKTIRNSIKDDGIFFCLDIKCSDNARENHPMMYSISLNYCMTTSLSQGGVGLGTCGLTESVVRDLSTRAGFFSVRRVPISNPTNIVWEIRPNQLGHL